MKVLKMTLVWSVLLLVVSVELLQISAGASVFKRDASSTFSICNLPGCECSNQTWIKITCTFNSTQTVTLEPKMIPPKLIEFFVIGGEEVTIRSNTFVQLSAFTYLKFTNTKKIVMEKNCLFHINSSTLFFEVKNCDNLLIASHAFKNAQGPISSDIRKCSYVDIQNSAFSRLIEGKFYYIDTLELSENAFFFENQITTLRHGPVGNLTFYKTKIPKIPNNAFSSVISEVNLKDTEIDTIDSGAFHSNHIDLISFTNSTIKRIASEAFSEKMFLMHLLVSKCKIGSLQSKAVIAGGISNLTVQFSSLADIQPGAINATIGNVVITDNNIAEIKQESITIKNWNLININDNHIRVLHNFLRLPEFDPTTAKILSFKGNYITESKPAALSFVKYSDEIDNFIFDDNAFRNQECMCFLREWLQQLIPTASNKIIDHVLSTSFCNVTTILAMCFQIEKNLMNMENFTVLACKNEDILKCEKYYGETKVIDTTATMLLDDFQDDNGSPMFILGITLGSICVIAILGTLVILSIRGGIWLKRKGYCAHFRNMHYNHQNELSNDDEGAMVPEDQPSVNEMPEELTQELLQALRLQLENPETHQNAREMIERLYEMFIIEDSYTNNNSGNAGHDDSHLYEELGNLQVQQHRNSNNHDSPQKEPTSFLKAMEDRLMPQQVNFTNQETLELKKGKNDGKPSLVNVYSEPQDSTVHLYSELQQKLNANDSGIECDIRKSSIKSSNSGKSMAFRPLPAKPEAGPSSQQY